MYEGLANDLLDAAKVDKGTSTSKLLERAAEAIERLKEQEPVKPIRLENWWECPSCNGNIVANMKYCPNCGKAVKWDETD